MAACSSPAFSREEAPRISTLDASKQPPSVAQLAILIMIPLYTMPAFLKPLASARMNRPWPIRRP